MAAFNFPNSPSTNDLHTENGVTFKWNGTIWLRVGNSYSDISTLNVSGIGTFGGHLYISEYLIHSGDTNTWFRFPSNDNITLGTSGAERVRIDANGFVAIGHDSPSSFSSGANNLVVRDGSGAGGITIVTPNNAEGAIFFADGTGGSGQGRVRYNHSDDSMHFSTNATERLRINSSGFVGINCNDPKRLLHLIGNDGSVGNSSGNSDTQLLIDNLGTNGSIIEFLSANNSHGRIMFSDPDGSNRGKIEYNHGNDSLNLTSAAGNPGYSLQSNQRSFFNVVNSYVAIDKNNTGVIMEFIKSGNQVGNIGINNTSTTYNTSSDYRLKENIVDLTGAITRLKQLKPRRFNFKVDDSITVDGFIAHEVTSVPEAITGTKDQVATSDDVASGISTAVGDPVYQGIDQSKIVPLLTAALQEAITEIETLKTKVAALESS